LHRNQQTVLIIHQAVKHIASAVSIGERIGDGKLRSLNRKIENFG
jgi:hypothetical protein